jgi:hypothetical protein
LLKGKSTSYVMRSKKTTCHLESPGTGAARTTVRKVELRIDPPSLRSFGQGVENRSAIDPPSLRSFGQGVERELEVAWDLK